MITRTILILITIINLCYSAIIFDNTYVISWNKNTESDLAGYRLYCNGVPKDVGIDTSVTWFFSDTTLTKKVFYVTAYDVAGNESLSSNVVSTLVSPVKWLYGDYDYNGRVDSYDATWFAISYYIYDKRFDYNLDGRIDNTDHLYFVINHGQILGE
jgi:hypothetical protein